MHCVELHVIVKLEAVVLVVSLVGLINSWSLAPVRLTTNPVAMPFAAVVTVLGAAFTIAVPAGVVSIPVASSDDSLSDRSELFNLPSFVKLKLYSVGPGLCTLAIHEKPGMLLDDKM